MNFPFKVSKANVNAQAAACQFEEHETITKTIHVVYETVYVNAKQNEQMKAAKNQPFSMYDLVPPATTKSEPLVKTAVPELASATNADKAPTATSALSDATRLGANFTHIQVFKQDSAALESLIIKFLTVGLSVAGTGLLLAAISNADFGSERGTWQG